MIVDLYLVEIKIKYKYNINAINIRLTQNYKIYFIVMKLYIVLSFLYLVGVRYVIDALVVFARYCFQIIHKRNFVRKFFLASLGKKKSSIF